MNTISAKSPIMVKTKKIYKSYTKEEIIRIKYLNYYQLAVLGHQCCDQAKDGDMNNHHDQLQELNNERNQIYVLFNNTKLFAFML